MTTKIESRALIYLPDGPGPHPVLCFLHGSGEGAADEAGLPQPLGKLLEHRSPAWHAETGSPLIARFAVVCPQLESGRRWEPEDAAWVDALVEGVHADRSRLVLTGFSRGGEGAFQIASRSRLPWRTLWAVDPALQRLPPPPAAGVRVWIHHGKAQPGSQNLAAFARQLGLEAWHPGARRVLTSLATDHAGTCAAAYSDPRVYDWLSAWRERGS